MRIHDPVNPGYEMAKIRSGYLDPGSTSTAMNSNNKPEKKFEVANIEQHIETFYTNLDVSFF
jgi:hypothetical protein